MKTIQMRCRKCNAITIIDEDRVIISCPHCGAKEWIVESDNVKTAQIKYSAIKDIELGKQQLEKAKLQLKREREKIELKKETYVPLIAFAVLAAISIFSFIMASSYLKVPDSSGNFKGKNYKEVVYQLQDAGFKNIETMSLGDLADGFLYNASSKVDTIEKISINGKTSFRTDDSFDKNAIVRIIYHTYPVVESEPSTENP